MRRPHKPKLVALVMLLFVFLAAVQLGASLAFYQAIDRQAVREDHARRIAELLVVSDRVHTLSPERTSGAMSTRHLVATVTPQPEIDTQASSPDTRDIAGKIVTWEPSLADRALRLAKVPGANETSDLVGSIRLGDGNWLNFRSLDINSMWPIANRAIVMTLVGAASLLALGLGLLHLLTRPLRRLTTAADRIGHGRDVDIRESGPRDIRELAHAMNQMQARIARLIRDQAKSFEAISHDLRTPLARQKIAAELVEDAEMSALMLANVDEMEGLLASLQTFLKANRMQARPETLELEAFVRDVLSTFGDHVEVRASEKMPLSTYREPLAITLFALAENAIHYGGKALVDIGRDAQGRAAIVVHDSGPGIPEQHFEDILDPFFRLDTARSRDTPGFGLGIPTAYCLMTRFNGGLHFATSDAGGLAVHVRVPSPDS